MKEFVTKFWDRFSLYVLVTVPILVLGIVALSLNSKNADLRDEVRSLNSNVSFYQYKYAVGFGLVNNMLKEFEQDSVKYTEYATIFNNAQLTAIKYGLPSTGDRLSVSKFKAFSELKLPESVKESTKTTVK
jgi:hypothetical protein